MLRVIVIGGSGATGKELLKELIASPKVASITSLGRRNVDDLQSEKLNQVIVDFEKLDDYKESFKGQEAAFCCLGTTKKQAGTAEKFRHIELDYSSAFSRLAKEANIEQMHLLTSQGANPNSWFLYMKTKGEIEEAMKRDTFKNLYIYRPGFLNRGATDRFGEKALSYLMSGIPVNTVARSMVKLFERQNEQTPSGVNVLYNKEIYKESK
ncbi:putative transcription coactivator [Heterostelium album PN500]|uniref:Putative transcription coactivator n=1 Tax=Heterostelium pallidum (strain ATCC 26659 / Pp 5 / PN500) TaxID=670386 RepID=D3BCD6_HETP5|nr:putative transcription coactivator [Heterostelium album PN500]EFA80926.1 putative transcription coactivator [Heterostelium album PN500]|eukprot:XP_020433044.1 putative transcription coactivator [Heterostelium album PN500]